MKKLFMFLIFMSSIHVIAQNQEATKETKPITSLSTLDSVIIVSTDTTLTILKDTNLISTIDTAIVSTDSLIVIATDSVKTKVIKAYAEPFTTDPFSHINVSLRFNTLGIGIEAATPLSNKFNLRAGFDIIPFNISERSLDLRDELKRIDYAFGYIPGYRAKGKINFFNAHILADFHPVERGIFHITAGFFIGSNKAELSGYLSDSNNNPAQLLPGYEWPVLEYENHTIDLTGGRLDFDLKLGKAIKPYLGVGIGQAVTKKRFGFKFDLGVMYQGDYSLKQNGIDFKFNEAIIEEVGDIDDYTKWLKWWPMVNLQVTYRIF